MIRPKIFPAYLPQYHETEDNNRFWGKGFSDWIAVKNAKPMFNGHQQPRIPLNNNYYDLSDIESIKWQVNLAKQYGVDGFNIYHYWFKNGKKELEKPAELLLDNPEISIEFFFTWDNAPWRRTWGNVPGNAWAPEFDGKQNNGEPTLVEFDYGDNHQWEVHFNYLLPFFRDDRYLKIRNRPVFLFFGQHNVSILRQMGKYWNVLAQKNGFDGMTLATKRKALFTKRVFDLYFTYEPTRSAWGKKNEIEKRILSHLGITLRRDFPVKHIYDYDMVWRRILHYAEKNVLNDIICALVRYDDSPRRGKDANIVINESPEKFERYFEKLYELACDCHSPLILLTAWNEWGEGAYLEPDEKDGFAYLEALKRVIERYEAKN